MPDIGHDFNICLHDSMPDISHSLYICLHESMPDISQCSVGFYMPSTYTVYAELMYVCYLLFSM